VLQDCRYKVISAVMLHGMILDTLKHERPERVGGGRPVECRRTPVYASTLAPGVPSVVLSRLHISVVPLDISSTPAPSSSQPAAEDQTANPSEPTAGEKSDITEDENTKSCTEASPLGCLKVPHVLISVALVEDQTYDTQACTEWLQSFPMLARYVNVQGIYKSYSTLLIVSVPVIIWDLIPSNPAIGFVSYVTSRNLLKDNPLKQQLSPEVFVIGSPKSNRMLYSETGDVRKGTGISSEDMVSHVTVDPCLESEHGPERGQISSTTSEAHNSNPGRLDPNPQVNVSETLVMRDKADPWSSIIATSTAAITSLETLKADNVDTKFFVKALKAMRDIDGQIGSRRAD
jgi:hypothetical protein